MFTRELWHQHFSCEYTHTFFACVKTARPVFKMHRNVAMRKFFCTFLVSAQIILFVLFCSFFYDWMNAGCSKILNDQFWLAVARVDQTMLWISTTVYDTCSLNRWIIDANGKHIDLKIYGSEHNFFFHCNCSGSTPSHIRSLHRRLFMIIFLNCGKICCPHFCLWLNTAVFL